MIKSRIVSIKPTTTFLLILLLVASIPAAAAFQGNSPEGWHMLEVREIQVVPHDSTLIFYFKYDIDIFLKFYSWVAGGESVEEYLQGVIIGFGELDTVLLNPLGGEAIFRMTNATSYQQGWYYYTESHEFSQQVGLLRIFASVLPNSTYYEASNTLMFPSFYYRG